MPSRGTTTCVFNEELSMFMVTKSKGKSICSGGYGIPHTIQICSQDGDGEPTATSRTFDFLFIEETLFLHERGMIEVYHPLHKNGKDTEKNEIIRTNVDHGELMKTEEIYNLMLNTMCLPLGVYLSYSHLRSQTYIVLRHTTNRLDILRKLEEAQTAASSQDEHSSGQKCEDQVIKQQCSQARPEQVNAHSKKALGENKDEDQGQHREVETNEQGKRKRRQTGTLASLKKELRSDAFHAAMPNMLSSCTVSNSDKDVPCAYDEYIAFDVYNPNTNFRKTMPGLPAFYVMITPFAEESPPFSTLKAIIKSCQGIPLKISSVSDLGTVAMFGMTDLGVPSIV